MPRRIARLLALAASLLTSSCGSGSTSPSPADVITGVWIGHATLTSASGGECVGPTLQSALGSRDVFAAPIQQTGSQLTARIAYQGNQTSCGLRGALSGSSFDLTMTSCEAGRVSAVRCQDGTMRDVELQTTRVTGSARAGAGSGVETSTWNVFAPGSTTPVGVLNLRSEFTWTELGLPSSDFHIFDGSVLPGYVDGVISIPAEDTPFCTKCGWF